MLEAKEKVVWDPTNSKWEAVGNSGHSFKHCHLMHSLSQEPPACSPPLTRPPQTPEVAPLSIALSFQ